MKRDYCLDTFALLAFLKGEPGKDKVITLLNQAKEGEIRLFVNIVNLIELHYTILRDSGKSHADEAVVWIKNLPIEIVNVELEDIAQIGMVKANYPVSLGDAFCIATAISRNLTIVTGDPDFKEVKDLVFIEWLPQKKKLG